jgi:Spy/CpxP family protein refolding chaperone
MNKLIATAFVSFMLVAAGSALAGDRSGGPGKGGKHQQRGPEGSQIVERFQHALRQLDLSEEQKAATKVIMEDLREQSREIGQELRDNQMALRNLITADTWNENDAARLAAQEGDLTAQRTLLMSKAMSDIYAQLTSDQRAEMAASAEERQERHSAKREARQERNSGS